MCEFGDEPSGFIQQWEVLSRTSHCKAEFCTIQLIDGMAYIIHIIEYVMSYR
jgi:hypothetical protein